MTHLITNRRLLNSLFGYWICAKNHFQVYAFVTTSGQHALSCNTNSYGKLKVSTNLFAVCV